MAQGEGGSGHLRVAIVGFGPKGLFALERLLHEAHRLASPAQLIVDLFDPHPVPGAGPVYDPTQPDFLRMNFAAGRLNMWCAGSRAAPQEDQLSFVDWRRARARVGLEDGLGMELGDDPVGRRYPPRAQVGRYLADGFERMRQGLPSGSIVTRRFSVVRAAHRRGSTWRLVTADDSTYDYDEILIAVGHGTSADQAQPVGSWKHAAPLIPAVFPVTHWLSPARVAAGAVVAVRGFALTFLDAALALTEGRGGRFERDEHPYRLRYSPSPGDPGVILPFSRTGRPMLPKPEPQLAVGIPALEEIAQSGCARILALPAAFSLRNDLVATLAATAAASLLAATRGWARDERTLRVQGASVRWLTAAWDGIAPPPAEGPIREVERSLAIGAGLHPPDLAWALGHTWRGVYPALVARLSGAGLADHDWSGFRRLATEMERLSFGPSALNAAKLVALVAAGRVDLTHVDAGRIASSNGITLIGSTRGERAVDVVLNAVLSEPGARQSVGGLLEQLVADGHARILSGRRGLEITPDSSCVGREGQSGPGLSAIGRPTEDCVIGNDTLSRALHPQVAGWARRVSRRLPQREMTFALVNHEETRRPVRRGAM